MKNRIYNLMRLFVGLFICATATVCMINSNVGLSPWDVFHQGVAKNVSITIGQASIWVGVVFVFIGFLMGEKVGMGTILNMIFVGKFIDLIMFSEMLPVANGIISGIAMLFSGMLLMGLGCVLYIGAGLGCGPRDTLMIALTRKTGKPIKLVRGCIEITALTIGFFLGGYVGFGTFVSAIGLGYCLQFIFKLCKFDGTAVKHKSLVDDFNTIRNYFSRNVETAEER